MTARVAADPDDCRDQWLSGTPIACVLGSFEMSYTQSTFV